MSKQLIVLKQAPIIEFSGMKARGLEVQEEIKEMNIPMIEPTEDNLSSMKKLRASLNKELKVFEDQRKMIHGKVTAPYVEFTDSYKVEIKVHYDQAVIDLKSKISEVEDKLLEEKELALKAYFDNANTHGFITIDNVGINIIRSASDKKLKTAIDDYIETVTADIKAIESMENSVRIKGYYERTLDLNDSISSVNSDIKREAEIEEQRIKQEKADRLAKEKADKERQERLEREAKERTEKAKRDAELAEERRIQADKNAKKMKDKEVQEAAELAQQEAVDAETRANEAAEQEKALEANRIEKEKADAKAKEVLTRKFTVTGTRAQLIAVRDFMQQTGVSYE